MSIRSKSRTTNLVLKESNGRAFYGIVNGVRPYPESAYICIYKI